MAYSLIALGSNLGDRAAQLRHAFTSLAQLPQTQLLSRSAWHETAAIGGAAGQPQFLNAAALLSTSLSPEQLFRRLTTIEAGCGRERNERWSARTLDLDILLYDDLVTDSPELTIPHPRMVYRPFVLIPAAEAAPWMMHAESGWIVSGLLEHVQQGRPSIAVAGESDSVDQIVGRITRMLDAAISKGSGQERPTAEPWSASGEHPRLLLAATGSASTDTRQLRKILNLPPTGPVAWISAEPTRPELDEALAAVQAVWPALARSPTA